ncbi:hypothetical protein [Phormidium nigroviride]
MLLEKIATLSELETALNTQLKQLKAERKALERKQAKLSEYLHLQTELMNDPDTSDTLTRATVTTTAPRLIEIEDGNTDTDSDAGNGGTRTPNPEPDNDGGNTTDTVDAIAPVTSTVTLDTETTADAKPFTLPVAPIHQTTAADTITAPVDPLRDELMKRSDTLIKSLGIKTKEARILTETMFGNGIVSRLHLDNQQLEKFTRYLETEHSKQQATKATVIKVEWENEHGGATVDADGVVRHFTCSKWDSRNPEFELITQGEKAIKSTWKTTQENPHFIALKRTLHDNLVQQCEKQGYILSVYQGSLPDFANGNNETDYTVYRDGQKLGIIHHSCLDNWTHSFQSKRGPLRPFAWVTDCLQALEVAYKAAFAEREKYDADTKKLGEAALAKYSIGME